MTATCHWLEAKIVAGLCARDEFEIAALNGWKHDSDRDKVGACRIFYPLPMVARLTACIAGRFTK